MSKESEREEAIKKYKLLAAFQGVLGIGLLICGILGSVFISEEEEEVYGPPYFLGGYIVGILQLLAAMIAGCVATKSEARDISASKKREIGCLIYGHYIIAMLTIMGCFMGLIFAGIFGISYSSDEDDDQTTRNRQVAYAIIAGCICALISMIFSMCLVCTVGQELGGVVTSHRGGRMVMTLRSNAVTTGHVSTSNQTAEQLEVLRTQNILLQQQLTLQQQQMMMSRQQQYSNDPVYPPPPPSYSSAVGDPGYQGATAFPSAPPPPPPPEQPPGYDKTLQMF